VQSNDVAFREGADLHEIAQLIRHPHTSTARLVVPWALTTDEWTLDLPGVDHIAVHPTSVAPGSNRSFSPSVSDAVRENLVGGEYEVVRSVLIESRLR
jgi:hypothetical protein